MLTQTVNGELAMVAGDDGLLQIGGLDTTEEIKVCFWIQDASSGFNVMEKHVYSNGQASVLVSLNREDTLKMNYTQKEKVYNYGVTLHGELSGTHSTFPPVGSTRPITFYPSGCKENI